MTEPPDVAEGGELSALLEAIRRGRAEIRSRLPSLSDAAADPVLEFLTPPPHLLDPETVAMLDSDTSGLAPEEQADRAEARDAWRNWAERYISGLEVVRDLLDSQQAPSEASDS